MQIKFGCGLDSRIYGICKGQYILRFTLSVAKEVKTENKLCLSRNEHA
jgi:hypothetical protein